MSFNQCKPCFLINIGATFFFHCVNILQIQKCIKCWRFCFINVKKVQTSGNPKNCMSYYIWINPKSFFKPLNIFSILTMKPVQQYHVAILHQGTDQIFCKCNLFLYIMIRCSYTGLWCFICTWCLVRCRRAVCSEARTPHRPPVWLYERDCMQHLLPALLLTKLA